VFDLEDFVLYNLNLNNFVVVVDRVCVIGDERLAVCDIILDIFLMERVK
jgi:hypothetical protein